MLKRHLLGVVLCACAFSQALPAQTGGKVDFRRDVQPILRSRCIDCHGPSKQMNGFRLDRRRDAMRGGTIAVIGPGNSAGSRLYLRLIGEEYGMQMPATGSLTPEQINTIKLWIDQGALWPDDASGDAPPTPADANAMRIMDALRNRDRGTFQDVVARFPKAAGLNGPNGSTPLMYAALYGDAESVHHLLNSGANPNAKNDAGATALMWAVGDVEKTRLLLEAGADVNARSDDGRTPLLIAAGQPGGNAVVKLLLDRGANPSAKSPTMGGDITPLAEAAYIGNDDVLQMLIQHGANVKQAGMIPLAFAALELCTRCVELLVKSCNPVDLDNAALFSGPPFSDPRALSLLLEHGASVKAKDPEGRTLLMLAAGSATLPVETVKNLIARGADVNAKTTKGETALDFAKRHGHTAVVDLLVEAGAKEGSASAPAALAIQPAPAASIRSAIERSIPLLQRTDVSFMQRSGCVSCHNNSLTSLTVAAARKKGYPVDDQTSRSQMKNLSAYLDDWSERARQGVGIPGDADTTSYLLLGMAAENQAPTPATDAMARFLKSRQAADGRWWILAHRPPLESSDIEVTAASLRALQVYAPRAQRAEYENAIQLAAGWLATAQPKTTEDRAFQLLGLSWAGTNKAARMKTARELLAQQRPDGGWAQLPSLASDAYATGQALVALKQSGAISASHPAYKRGTQFLMATQLEDGSWYVKSRALTIQPFFESGFPHGRDQFISAAATNWATMALAGAK